MKLPVSSGNKAAVMVANCCRVMTRVEAKLFQERRDLPVCVN